MARRWALLGAALTLWAAAAAAEPAVRNAPKAPEAHEVPFHLYLAKGEPNACGEGCSEWIAAEGRFDRDAFGRVQAFLNRQGLRKLPVYFHSPGGDGNAAIAIGRRLRMLGIRTGVGKTIPQGCASATDISAACRAAKRSAQAKAVTAEWRPDANCSSACVWALIGGTVRHVPPSARLGIHATKLTVTRFFSDGRTQVLSSKQFPSQHKTKAAEHMALTRAYIREMGIGAALLDEAIKVPHESIRYLSRDEIAALGIDRRPFAETPWLVTESANDPLRVSKWIVEARGPDRKDYRISVVSLACSPTQRARLLYVRGLASNEIGKAVTAMFTVGNYKARFALPANATKYDSIDMGGQFSSLVQEVSFSDLERAAEHGAIGVMETDPLAATGVRAIELSTQALAEGIRILREKCVTPTPGWKNEAGIPFVTPEGKLEYRSIPVGGNPVPGEGRK